MALLRKGFTLPAISNRQFRTLLLAYTHPHPWDKLGTLRLLERRNDRAYHDAALANNIINLCSLNLRWIYVWRGRSLGSRKTTAPHL